MEIEKPRKISKILVCIRKRPLTKKEIKKGYKDIIEVVNDQSIVIKEEKLKLDLTKFVENHNFTFDLSFNETHDNQLVYEETVKPMVDFALEGGRVSCFAYGQTGSGKTYTMIGNEKSPGIYVQAANDIFNKLGSYEQYQEYRVVVSYFEIYCGKLYDLLNKRNELTPREDKRQNIQIVGLLKHPVNNTDDLFQMIDAGNKLRVTSCTGKNQESSRSHAILQFRIYEQKKKRGLLSFIDLAGNERGGDTYGHDNQTRIDGAEISKSLLALKECIRALDQDKKHIPFRGSKLTMVLRDSFIGNCKSVMIGNISPAEVNCEYTLNTLRYADRVKELKNNNRKGKKDELMLPRQRSNKALDWKNVAPKKKKNKNLFQQENKSFMTNLKSNTKMPEIKNFSGKKPNGSKSINKNSFAKKIQPIFKNSDDSLHKVPLLLSKSKGDLKQQHEQVIEQILQEEDRIIESHKKFVHKTKKTIDYEENMIFQVNQPGSNIDEYVASLSMLLENKQKAIEKIQMKLKGFQDLLEQEKNISEAIENHKENCIDENTDLNHNNQTNEKTIFFQQIIYLINGKKKYQKNFFTQSLINIKREVNVTDGFYYIKFKLRKIIYRQRI